MNVHGKEGLAFVGANEIAEVVGFSFSSDTDLTQDNVLKDVDKTYKTHLKGTTGQIECLWDPTDSLAQAAMANGSEITLNLYPQGNTSGKTYYTGSVIINNESMANAIGAMVTANFSFTVNGPWTKSVVA